MYSTALAQASSAEAWTDRLNDIDLVAGSGSLGQLDKLAAAFETTGTTLRILLVTDPGLESTGHVDRAHGILNEAGFTTERFTGVHQNPSAAEVMRGADVALGMEADLLVALGGGSAMDCAKGINFVSTNGGKIEDYWGYGKATDPLLPMIGIPTTCGTGSDAQSYALISQEDTHRKMACGDPAAKFRTVLFDPELLTSAPPFVRATAGLDAISHAIESHVSTARDEVSAALSKRAFDLLTGAFEQTLDDPEDLDSFGQMQWGAHLAGAAIEHSMLGAAHAAANPLTARHGVIHGEAVNLMLPHVVRFNAAAAHEHYAGLAPSGGEDELLGLLRAFTRKAGLATSLQDKGIPREALPELAELATHEWTGNYNPRSVSEGGFLELYEAAL